MKRKGLVAFGQSNIWRATKPLRVVLDKVKRKNRAVRLSR